MPLPDRGDTGLPPHCAHEATDLHTFTEVLRHARVQLARHHVGAAFNLVRHVFPRAHQMMIDVSSHRPHLDGVRDQNGNTIWAWYNGIDSLPVPAAETIVDWSPATWRTFRTRIEAYLATALDNADTTSLGWPAFNENATRYLATHVPSPAFPNDGGVIDAPGADPRLVPVSELIPGDVFCYEHAGTHYKITAPTWPVPGDGDGVIWVFVAEQPWPLTLPASQLVQATYRPREIAIRCLLCGNTTRAWVNTAYLSGGRGICRRCDRGTKA